MKSNIRIRQTTNYALIRELDNTFFSASPIQNIEESVWWVAYDGKTPVGYAGLRQLKHEPGVFFCRAGVVESHRGRGIHRRLIRVRIRWARRHNLYCLTYTAHWNTKSANNLIDMGFRVINPSYEWGLPKSIYLCLE